MIYSKFGTALVLVSKSASAGGRVTVLARVDGTTDELAYELAGLKADGGPPEIDAAVAGLPTASPENRTERRQKRL